MRLLHRLGQTYFSFGDVEFIVLKAHHNVVNEHPPVEARSCIACVVDDADNWGLSDVPLFNDVSTRASLCVYFRAIQVLYS